VAFRKNPDAWITPRFDEEKQRFGAIGLDDDGTGLGDARGGHGLEVVS